MELTSVYHPTAIVRNKTIAYGGPRPSDPQDQAILAEVSSLDAQSVALVREGAEHDNCGVRFPLSQDGDSRPGVVVVEDSHRNSILRCEFTPEPESLTCEYMGKPYHEASWDNGRLVDCRVVDGRTHQVTEFHIDRKLGTLTFSGPVYY